jgi:signal transduction histidine kinase
MMKESIRLNDPATFYEYTEMINTSAIQTLRLLDNLLEWANSQRGKLTFTPVQVILKELVKDEFVMLDDMAIGKNIELRNNVNDLITVVADKNMLRTILRNLITNAVKFTHRDGKVEVDAIVYPGHVEVTVSDNGIGMPKVTMAKLFRIDANLSTRGTENEKGTGLGLFLCKEFVEKHGGKIWVVSEENKGSVFHFILPLN